MFFIYNSINANNKLEKISQEKENTENLDEEKNGGFKNKFGNKKIYIHLDGKIKNPGVIEIEENSRLNDAIEKAGGLLPEANSKAVNLAMVLNDGSKIYIPSKEENDNSSVGNDSQDLYSDEFEKENKKSEKKKNEKVNINKANKQELTNIKGVGDSTAEKIITYRKEHGKFNTVEELKEVKGIGDSKFNNIKDSVTLADNK